MSSHGDRLDKADDTMDRETTRMPAWMLVALDQLVENGEYENRSEAVRAAVRDLLEGEHV